LLLELYDEKIPYSDEVRKRNYISAICAISKKDIEEENFRGVLEGKNCNHEFLSDDTIKSIRPHYIELSTKRNEINHAKGTITFDELKRNFEIRYKSCLDIVNRASSPLNK
jgi:hypothetical protein